MRVFGEIVGELHRPDAERMIEHEQETLEMPPEPALRAGVVALHQAGALLKKCADGIDRQDQPEEDGRGDRAGGRETPQPALARRSLERSSGKE